MRSGLRLFHGIRMFGAALLCLSASAKIGLAAETQVSFAGKTIRVVVPVAAGGGLDLQSRALAPLLQAYIPGNPPVIVQNVAAGPEQTTDLTFTVGRADRCEICHHRFAGSEPIGIGAVGSTTGLTAGGKFTTGK